MVGGGGERREGISRHAENARKARKFKRNLILECNLSRHFPPPPKIPCPPHPPPPTPPRGNANRSHYRNHCAFNKPLHYYLPHSLPPSPSFPLFCLFGLFGFVRPSFRDGCLPQGNGPEALKHALMRAYRILWLKEEEEGEKKKVLGTVESLIKSNLIRDHPDKRSP